MQIIDLSHVIETSPTGIPDFLRTEVEYHDHAEGAKEFSKMFDVPIRLMRDQEGPAGERLNIGTHASTHLDAPYHYNSRIGGEPAETIDELPLSHFYGPGVVVDASANEDGEVVTTGQIQKSFELSGHELNPGDIVLIQTKRDQFYKEPDYMHRGPGVTPDATRWLFEHGVRVMGIDAWGWDRPQRFQAEEAKEKDEPGIFWGAHQVDLPYSQIERLTNLDALPATGFTVCCFPLKIKGASAAPARVVALVED
jgi:kynurenine formamidase